MSFDTTYRPLTNYISVKTDYNRLPYRFRLNVKRIQSKLMDIRQISKKVYRLYVLEDGYLLYDIIKNKIVCFYDYSSPIPALLRQLDNLLRYWKYEKDYNKYKTSIEYNDWLTLKLKYNE